jgi:hypothetical protein
VGHDEGAPAAPQQADDLKCRGPVAARGGTPPSRNPGAAAHVVAELPDRMETYRSRWLPGTTRPTLRLIVLFDLGGAPDREPQVAELQAQGLARDAQDVRRLLDVPLGVFQDEGQQEPVDLGMRLRVQLAGVRPETLPQSLFASGRKSNSGRRMARNV